MFGVPGPRSKPESSVFWSNATEKKGCLISYNLTTTPKTHVSNGSHGDRMNERYSRARLQRLFSSGWTACIRPAVWWAYGGAKIFWLIPSLERLRKAMTRFPPRFSLVIFHPWCTAQGVGQHCFTWRLTWVRFSMKGKERTDKDTEMTEDKKGCGELDFAPVTGRYSRRAEEGRV